MVPKLVLICLCVALGACAGSPAAAAPKAAAAENPCAELVACCQAINRDDATAQRECQDYLREPPATCRALKQEVRRRKEGIAPPACR